MLSFCSCKCNPFSYWNVISPSNRRFTFWNRLKFFNPNLINFNMIFPSWVRLGFELNSKLNVFTAKEEIQWLNTQCQAGRKHLWSNDIKQLTRTVVKRGSFLAKISICFKLEKKPCQPYLIFMWVIYPCKLEFTVLVFVEGGQLENLKKNLKTRQEPTTNATHIWH